MSAQPGFVPMPQPQMNVVQGGAQNVQYQQGQGQQGPVAQGTDQNPTFQMNFGQGPQVPPNYMGGPQVGVTHPQQTQQVQLPGVQEIPQVSGIPMYQWNQQPQVLPAGYEQQHGVLPQVQQQPLVPEQLLGQQPQVSQTAGLEKQIEKLVSVMAAQQVAQNKSNQPDFLNMSSQELLEIIAGDPEKGVAPKLADVLKHIKDASVQEAESKLREDVDRANQLIEIMTRQHQTLQAHYALQRLETTFKSRDPLFEQNLREAGTLLSSPVGKAFIDADPSSAMENAYLYVQARKINTPEYQHQLALSYQQQFQNQNLNRVQAGPLPGVTQNQVPLQPVNTQPYQQQGQAVNDMDMIAKVMQHGNTLGIPNVRVSMMT